MRYQFAQKLTMAGVMAALVFVMTYIPKVPVGYGYVHLGDGVVFLASMLLGGPGIAAAALGSALSDLLAGFTPYILPTAVIKAVMALIVWKMCKEDSWPLAVISFLLAEAVMIAGYFAFECAMYGSAAALAAIGANAIQGLAGVALGLVCQGLRPRIKRMMK